MIEARFGIDRPGRCGRRGAGSPLRGHFRGDGLSEPLPCRRTLRTRGSGIGRGISGRPRQVTEHDPEKEINTRRQASDGA